MKISALASGSSGNCFYVENKNKAILVDCGLSCKQVEKRLMRIGRKIENVEGIFITHEHTDHIYGTDVLARKYQIPVFADKQIKNLCSQEDLIYQLKKETEISGMQVQAFSKKHDSVNPVSFNIINGKKISIMTDVGEACRNVKKNIKDSDFLLLEANHDLEMLEKGFYPDFLKRRIKSSKGHLSNKEAALTVLEYANENLKHVLLSHLSENNNTEEKVLQEFQLLKERKDLNAKIDISSRQPTKLFKV